MPVPPIDIALVDGDTGCRRYAREDIPAAVKVTKA
jgi:hypothetical protein